MDYSFRAYSGSKPYIFVSYCHADRNRVYPIIGQLHAEGYRIWYDEGIAPTEEWRGVINRHIIDCGIFLIFVTENSMRSHEVVKETTFAINLKKRMHIIYLEDVSDRHINASLLADFMNSQRVMAYCMHSSVFDIKLRQPLGEFKDVSAPSSEPLPVREKETSAHVRADNSLDTQKHGAADFHNDSRTSDERGGSAALNAPQLWNDTVRSRNSLSAGVVIALVIFAAVWTVAILATDLIFMWPMYLGGYLYLAYVIVLLIVSRNAKNCADAESLRNKLNRGRSMLWASSAVMIIAEAWIGFLLTESSGSRYINPDYYSAGEVIRFELTTILLGLAGVVLVMLPLVTSYLNFGANSKIRMMLKSDISSIKGYQRISRYTRRFHMWFVVEAVLFTVVAECVIIISTAESQWFFEDSPRIVEILFENWVVASIAVPVIISGIIIRRYYNTLLTFGDRLAESILSGK